MTITPATHAELAEALAILYGPGAEAHVGHAFRMAARGELSPKDLLIAHSQEAIGGAIFARQLPGGVAILWPPRAISEEMEDALVRAALDHVGRAKAVEAFLPPDEMRRAEPLLSAGFQHVTRIWQMAMPTSSHAAKTRSAGKPRLTALSALSSDLSVVHTTLIRAHDDSLDCPELNLVLTPEEVIAGYHDAAPDLTGWLLAKDQDLPVGVVILAGQDLMFLGVVPERRGQGIGRWLLEQALAIVPDLCLNVDMRNAPAFQLYRSAGFDVVDAREVFLYFPNSSADATVAKLFRL
jgi:mycothiol synthase